MASSPQQITINVSSLTGGIYIIQVTIDNNISRQKFIRQ
jgi:hypothetical protein